MLIAEQGLTQRRLDPSFNILSQQMVATAAQPSHSQDCSSSSHRWIYYTLIHSTTGNIVVKKLLEIISEKITLEMLIMQLLKQYDFLKNKIFNENIHLC